MASQKETKTRSRHSEIAQPLDILPSGDWAGITAAIAAAAIVYGAYLLTHEYPAYGAGMYMQIAKQIRLGGFQPPTRILHYTENGTPFAYPPLQFYVAAVIRALTGIDPITYTRYMPGLVILATLVPYYYLAKEFLNSVSKASVAAAILAVAPPVLMWHLSAGGIVRAPAFFITIAGMYGGARLFRLRDRRWLGPCIALFGLTILSHPTYVVFFGMSFLLLYAFYDRSPRGLVDGAAVALGGLLLAAPWWGWIAATHGLGIFTATAGTHSGLWGGTGRLYWQFVRPLVVLDGSTPFYVAAYAGGAYALYRRRYFLPVWMVLSAYVLGENRFFFVAGAMLISILVFDLLNGRVGSSVTNDRERLVVGVLGVALVSAVVIGALFGAGVTWGFDGQQTQPAFIDDTDMQAMEWVEYNTAPSDDFVVIGDTAEWFPYFTDRSILVGPWGAEWKGHEEYQGQISMFRGVSDCDSSTCITQELESGDVHPQYIYLSKDSYTVRGQTVYPSSSLRTSMIADNHYKLAYENEGVMVFRVADE